jgi:prephenate dehydratase
VNLSRIESRPIGDELGRYLFSIDAEGHIAEARMAEALMGLHRMCPVVRFLGSYPKADRVPNEVRAGTRAADFDAAREWLSNLRVQRTGDP